VSAFAARSDDTDWSAIVSLYDTLLAIAPSPVATLSRAIAVGECEGPERGLAEIGAIPDRDRINDYPFYDAAVGECELRRGRPEAARGHFERALDVARNPMERRFLGRRIAACGVPVAAKNGVMI
jgi:predicted RNA polymerase sigma factor